MTELIPGVEYLYTIPAEKPTDYWVLIVVFIAPVAVKTLRYGKDTGRNMSRKSRDKRNATHN